MNTNFISSRHVKRENTSLPVDVRRSKTSLLKLPIMLSVVSSKVRANSGESNDCFLQIFNKCVERVRRC